MSNSNLYPLPLTGQGAATEATAADLVKDAAGITNPNLHRRIDPQPPLDDEELADRVYSLNVMGYDSYRTTEITLHDEESETCEIP